MEKNSEEFQQKIFDTILRMEVMKGHLQWSISDIARFSGQKRPLIYYHFGKDKNEILHQAWEYMLNTLFAIDDDQSLGIRERMKMVIKKVNAHPYLFVLFYLEKRKDNEISKMIKNCENQLFDVLSKRYSNYGKKEILKMYLLELGAIAYQELSDEDFINYFPR